MAGPSQTGQRVQRAIVAGGAGDDQLAGSLDRDIIDTGEGNNVVFADLAAAHDLWSDAGWRALTGRERIAYDRRAARAIDEALENALNAGRPLTDAQQRQLADVIIGGGGDDILFAGQGHDTVNGGGGDDRILAGGGNDVVSGGIGNDVIDGGAGNDTLAGDAGNDTILGDAGADVVFGGAGSDVIEGEDGNDTIWGGAEADAATGDSIAGGAGSDWIMGEGGRDSLDGGAGADRLDGGSGDDVLRGGAGNDVLTDGAGNDSLEGGDDNDWLDGGAGADTLDGGDGNDVAVFANDSRASGPDVYRGGGGTDTLRLVLTAAQYAVYADALAPLLQRISGETIDFSTLVGAGAAPLRLVASGFEKLEVQVQVDPVGANLRANGVFTATADRVDFDALLAGWAARFDAQDGNDEVMLASARTSPLGYSADTVFNAGGGDDTVIGRDRADRIDGGSGNDLIMGGSGDDTLWGGSGADRLTGEAGANLALGGDGNDVISLAGADGGTDGDGTAFSAVLAGAVDGGGGTDRLSGAAGSTLVIYAHDNLKGIEAFGFGAASDRLVLTGYADPPDRISIAMGAGHDTVAGSRAADFIAGEAGCDRLDGAEGNDTLFGGAGDDGLAGGEGADLLNGGDGGDTLVAGAGDDVLFGEGGRDSLAAGTGSDALYAGAGNDTLTGSLGTADDATLFGEEGDDDLTAGRGADVLSGGAGADTIRGGGGEAYLSGGAGADRLEGSGADTLNGGAGDDTLVGTGSDTLLLTGDVGDYDVAWDAGAKTFSVHDRRADGEGTDTVSGIGLFRFRDAQKTAEDLMPAPTRPSLTLLGTPTPDPPRETSIVFDVLNALRDINFAGAPGSSADLVGHDGPDRVEFIDYTGVGNAQVDLAAGSWTVGRYSHRIVGFEAVATGAGLDSLAGSAGAETLDGGSGGDTLSGGGGSDVLVGGEGSDAFVLDGGEGAPRIADFSDADYVIFKPSGYALSGRPAAFDGDRLTFSRPGDASYLLFDRSTHGLYLDRTGGDARDALLVATFDGVSTLAPAVTFG